MKYSLLILTVITSHFGFILQDTNSISVYGNLTIEIPSSFIPTDSVQIDKKYSDKPFRPALEFFQVKDSVTISLSDISNPLSEDGMEEIRAMYEKRFKDIYPNSIWLDTKTVSKNKLTVAYLEIIDSDIYYLIFFTPVEGKQVHISISAQRTNLDEIRMNSRKIMNSMTVNN